MKRALFSILGGLTLVAFGVTAASAAVSAFQPSQSPSANPSSIEMMGYCRTQPAYISTISSGVRVGSPDFLNT